MAAAAAYADVDQFTRFWAMCAVVGQLDSFPYSNPGDDYFAYANPATGRLAFMPWGIDESFYAGDIDVSVIHSVLAVQCKAIARLLRQVRRQRLGHPGAGRAPRLGRGARPRRGADRALRRAGHAQVVHDRPGRHVPGRHGVLHRRTAARASRAGFRRQRRAPDRASSRSADATAGAQPGHAVREHQREQRERDRVAGGHAHQASQRARSPPAPCPRRAPGRRAPRSRTGR